jgi:hypothetical protein
MKERSYRRAVTMGLLVIATPLALSLVAYASGTQLSASPATTKIPTKRCILDPPDARYHHMTYLKERRDRVLRDGRRSGQSIPSLMSTCSGCHGEQSQFCDKCHARAGVNLDCFGCHSY